MECALTVCSVYRRLSTEFQKIRTIGIKNGYHKSFIDTLIGVNLTQHLNKNDNDDGLAPTSIMNDQTITTTIKFNDNDKKWMYAEIPLIGDSTTHAMNKRCYIYQTDFVLILIFNSIQHHRRQFKHSLRTRIPL